MPLKSVEGAPQQVQCHWEWPTEIDATANNTAKLENGVRALALTKLQPESQATQLASTWAVDQLNSFQLIQKWWALAPPFLLNLIAARAYADCAGGRFLLIF